MLTGSKKTIIKLFGAVFGIAFLSLAVGYMFGVIDSTNENLVVSADEQNASRTLTVKVGQTIVDAGRKGEFYLVGLDEENISIGDDAPNDYATRIYEYPTPARGKFNLRGTKVTIEILEVSLENGSVDIKVYD